MIEVKKQVIIGIVLAAVSFTCFAEREEQWDVTVGKFTSTFHLTIKDDGNFSGVSEWTCCSGINNRIEGKIKINNVILTRYLEDNERGQTQTWTGNYYNGGRNIKGNYSGTGGPGAWSANVTIVSSQ